MKRKKPKADLRNYHTIFLQTGLIATLLIFIVAAKVNLVSEQAEVDLTEEQEVVEMEEIQRTEQIEKPPPPPRPPVPVEVPNDEIIEDTDINLDAELNLDEPLDMPPPPEDEPEEDFFVVVEQMPELIGGQKGLYEKLEYPDMARKAGIEGMVIVQFIVNEEGNIENPRVLRGIGGGCDEEALRVIRASKFKPGRQRGRPVRVQASQTIFFRLQN